MSLGISLGLAMGTALAGTAHAQEKTAVAGPDQDIVVTANRKEERLQTVGLTLSLVEGEALAKQHIQGLDALARSVPGFAYAPSPNDTPVYVIRGVGFYDSSVAAYGDVAIYLDQVPLVLPVFSKLTAFDLSRVEVLKGPQGTQFGLNATGGAINLISAKPTAAPSAGVDLTVGRFGRTAGEGYLSGPLGSTLKARIAIRLERTGDWQRSYTRHDTNGSIGTAAGRLLLDWSPGTRTDFVLNVNGWIDRSDPEAPQLSRPIVPADLQAAIGTIGLGGPITPDLAILHYPAASQDPRAADWTPTNHPRADNHLIQASLTGNFDVTDDLRVQSISTFVRYRMLNRTEGDGTALYGLDLTRDHATAKSVFQEVRLLGNAPDAKLNGAVGGTVERTSVDEEADSRFDDGSAGTSNGFTRNSYSSDQKMLNWSLYANAEYKAADRITVRAGVRHSWSRRRAVNASFATPGFVETTPGYLGTAGVFNYVWANIFTPLYCPGKTYVPALPGQSLSIDPATCTVGDYRATLREQNTAWRAGVDYSLTAGTNLYGNISKGYKAGGFPIASAATTDQYQPVKQESVLDYEIGLRSRLSSSFSVNLAAFIYDYRNKQLRSKTVSPVVGLLDQLVSVPRSRLHGIDGGFDARLGSHVKGSASASWLDTKVLEYQGITGTRVVNGLLLPVTASFAGETLPFAPRFQAVTSWDYSSDLSERLQAYVGFTVSASTRSYASLNLARQQKSDAEMNGRVLLDLRAGVSSSDGRWRASIWGNNVTNRFYTINATRAFDSVVRYAGRPAEYGVTISRRWGR